MVFSEVTPRNAYSLLTQLNDLVHLHVELGAKVLEFNSFFHTRRNLGTLVHQ